MKIEDYSKYYIQGSDHYLIPKNTIAFVINAFSKDNGKINMFNAQYGSEEVEKLKGDINENKHL